MNNKKLISFSGLYDGIKKAPKFLAEHIFLFLVFLILINFLIGLVLFYGNKLENSQFQNKDFIEQKNKFNKEGYDKLLKKWELIRTQLESFSKDSYENPFN